jgi:hypothetical protein
MSLTVEQALALAPDGAAASSGRKLGNPKSWRGLGRSERALWGECQGSALYQVRVDLGDLTTKCSCPSRKFPCKHALGLLVLAATEPAALTTGEPPAWVVEWLQRRAARAEPGNRGTEEQGRSESPDASDAGRAKAAKSGAKKADQRLKRVVAGLDALDLWLDDLVRNGLASVEAQPASFWEGQARRLVDAQAPGLAGRVRRLAAVPHATPDWPARLLDELGRLALLTHAFRRLDQLDAALQDDVRGLIGWALDAEEVAARGETVRDEWAVVGQRITTEDRLRQQWSWLVGQRSGRAALVLQFAHGGTPFKEVIAPGMQFAADLAYWPSAHPQRALIHQRLDPPSPVVAMPVGAPTLSAYLDSFARAIARQPWLDRDLAILRDVVPVCDGEPAWVVRDIEGAALPLAGGDHWRLLALSGGRPLDLVAEWDGATLVPLGALAAGGYHLLAEAQ